MTSPKKRRTRVAAYGLLLDREQILLCRISEKISNHRGKWTLPGGGVEWGESPTEAMIREVKEETGLIVEASTLADIDSIIVEVSGITYHSIRIIYRTKIIGGRLRNEVDGTTDLCQWWHRDHIPDAVDLAKVGVKLAFS